MSPEQVQRACAFGDSESTWPLKRCSERLVCCDQAIAISGFSVALELTHVGSNDTSDPR